MNFDEYYDANKKADFLAAIMHILRDYHELSSGLSRTYFANSNDRDLLLELACELADDVNDYIDSLFEEFDEEC